MIVERSSNPQFVSNTYLVDDGHGGPAFFVDAGGPVAPLVAAAERRGLQPTHVLLTHHHFDHVCELDQLRGVRRGSARRGGVLGGAVRGGSGLLLPALTAGD